MKNKVDYFPGATAIAGPPSFKNMTPTFPSLNSSSNGLIFALFLSLFGMFGYWDDIMFTLGIVLAPVIIIAKKRGNSIYLYPNNPVQVKEKSIKPFTSNWVMLVAI